MDESEFIAAIYKQGKSRKLLLPGISPINCVPKLSTIESTWSNISLNEILSIVLFCGLFCKFNGSS